MEWNGMDMVMDDESSTSMPRTTRQPSNDKADVKNNEDDKENDDKQRQRQQMEMVMDVRQVLAQPPRGGGRETPVAKNHW
jgi:hypothetical protein